MTHYASSKKNIIDFLWDWAGNDTWKKQLAKNIITTETYLSDEERQEIYDLFLQSIKLKSSVEVPEIIKPTFTLSSKKMDLLAISDIRGVNKLANNQQLEFAKNVTVLYGENGSGKTGYCRLLKSLGYSYDKEDSILSNINSSNTVPKYANVKYRIDEEEHTFSWNGKRVDVVPDLQNITVFNNSCVQVALSDRGLLITPSGFQLFNIISEELEMLAELLQRTIEAHPTNLDWVNNLNVGTPHENFLRNLTGSSSLEELKQLAAFNEEHRHLLESKETELSNLNKALISKELDDYILYVKELDGIIAKIEHSCKYLNQESWEELLRLKKENSELEKKADGGIKEIAEAQNIKLYTSESFKKFIFAADQYLKELENANLQQNDTCVYCQQILVSDSSKKLLSSYKEILNSNNQTRIIGNKKRLNEISTKIDTIDSDISFQLPVFGMDAGSVRQPECITVYNSSITELKKHVSENNVGGKKIDVDYESTLKYLSEQKDAINRKVSELKDTLDNIVVKEKEIKATIYELQDRLFVSTRIAEVEERIKNKKIVHLLLKNKNSFNTASISRKTSEARAELVEQNFNAIFIKELQFLRKSHIPVEVNFATSRGQSKIQQRMRESYMLSQILSEGEQKAISLAQFLTELQLDNSRAPIVFDDPVNSLDHHIIDEVAKRLISLSSDRQVVVFTHSILLFSSLLHNSKNELYKKLQYEFYNIKSEYGETGILAPAEEEIDRVKDYIKKINLILNNKSKERSEEDVAAEGYGFLRSAIELSIELHIFRGTVKRYQKNIALTNFLKIDGELINNNKAMINSVFERCCEYINAHTNPDAITTKASLDQLQIDFDIFQSIHNKFPLN